MFNYLKSLEIVALLAGVGQDFKGMGDWAFGGFGMG